MFPIQLFRSVFSTPTIHCLSLFFPFEDPHPSDLFFSPPPPPCFPPYFFFFKSPEMLWPLSFFPLDVPLFFLCFRQTPHFLLIFPLTFSYGLLRVTFGVHPLSFNPPKASRLPIFFFLPGPHRLLSSPPFFFFFFFVSVYFRIFFPRDFSPPLDGELCGLFSLPHIMARVPSSLLWLVCPRPVVSHPPLKRFDFPPPPPPRLCQSRVQ